MRKEDLEKHKVDTIEDSPKTAANKARKVANKTRRKNKYECKCYNSVNNSVSFTLRSPSKDKLKRIVDTYCKQYKALPGEIERIQKD